MATTTVEVNGVSCNIDDFEIGPALAGCTLVAGEIGDTPTYYPATEFKVSKEEYAVEYGYQAKVQNQTWKFNEFGEELHGRYQLYIASAAIINHQAGDNVSDTGSEGGTGTKYYNLTSLNYRETVAIQTLNAMIYHIPDPISYDEASIRLLVKKAFDFSEEFMSQAMTIRTQNATYTDGQITPDANASAEEILINISNTLNQLKGAFMVDATQSTPADSVLNELTQIKTQQQNIATALTGTGGTGIAAQLGQIVTNTASVRDALIDTSDPNNPVNRIDNMATIVASQGSDIEDIKTYTNQINSALYTDTTDTSSSTIRTAGKSLWEIEKCQDDIKRSLKFDELSYDGNRVVDNVISINGKLGSN